VAICLARASAHVVIADQAPQRIAPVTPEIEALGVQALGIPTDVSRADDVKRIVRQTVERFGRIDILVNNAGTLVVKSLVEKTEEEWDRVLDVNLKGMFLCCRDVAPEMIARQRGAIANIASADSTLKSRRPGRPGPSSATSPGNQFR
jgi:NAD(P)-dependent dehydrogenase (short-subunit alcohol dehydrogenase family)